MVERAAVFTDSDNITIDSILLSHEMTSQSIRADPPCCSGRKEKLKDCMALYEKEILVTALNAATSIREAARNLGLSHTALIKKIAKHSLRRGDKSYQWCE